MYLLKFLEAARTKGAPAPSTDKVTVEWRLACSGELHNKFVPTDWHKSDVARILLTEPFRLLVISRPFNDYPQELSVRFALDYATEEGGPTNARQIRTFVPDEEIVSDLCSILTLLSRRLISPIVQTRQIVSNLPPSSPLDADVAMPILGYQRHVAWKQRGVGVVTSFQGQQVIRYDPPPVGVDPQALRMFLLDLPARKDAETIVYAARRYRDALEMIETRPEIAYQLLVSMVESLARTAYQPTLEDKMANQQRLID